MSYDGKKIIFWRQKRGWSGAELARRAKISQPSLWELEQQVTKKPKHETLFSLAAALGVPITALYPDKPRKGAIPTEDQLAPLFAALDDDNKQALVAAAEVMLRNQKKRSSSGS